MSPENSTHIKLSAAKVPRVKLLTKIDVDQINKKRRSNTAVNTVLPPSESPPKPKRTRAQAEEPSYWFDTDRELENKMLQLFIAHVPKGKMKMAEIISSLPPHITPTRVSTVLHKIASYNKAGRDHQHWTLNPDYLT
jgi:hypothetical protein